MHNKSPFALMASTLLLVTGNTFANGFALNEQSVSGLGTAYAGRASSALDATTVYGNPAGMSRLQKEQISGGFTLIIPDVDISDFSATNSFGPVSGGMNNDITHATPVPFGFYVNPLNDQWHFGFGVYSPLGLGTNYDNDSAVRYLADKSKVEAINLQPTLSYKVNDKFSVGLGIIASYAKITFGSRLPLTDGLIESKGDDWGFGYNLGLLYQVTPSTRAGLTYHSILNYDFNTDTRVRNLSPLLGPDQANIDGHLKRKPPESVDFSITHELDSQWTLYAGAVWTKWSRWQSVTFNNSNSPTPIFNTVEQDLKWHDTWGYSIGASYQLTPRWILRTGLALDQSPAGSTQNVRVPVADRKIISVGAGWKADEHLSFDFGYSYLKQGTITLRQQDERGNNFEGDYKVAAHGLGIQMNYQF